MRSGPGIVVVAATVVVGVVLWMLAGDDRGRSQDGHALQDSGMAVPSTHAPSGRDGAPDSLNGRVPAPQSDEPMPLRLGAARGSVTVRAVDEAGAPVAGVRVGWRSAADKQKLPKPPILHLDHWWRPAVGVTDEAGELVVPLVPDGAWFFAVGALPEWGFEVSESVRCDGQTPTRVTVHLARLPAARVISGRIFGSDGEPLRYGRVAFHWTSPTDRPERVDGTCTLEGRFALLPPAGARGDLRVSSSAAKHRSTTLRGVRAGTRGLEVHLGAPEFFELRVEDFHGVEQDSFQMRFSLWLDERWVRTQSPPRKRPGEALWWKLPTVPFRVSVEGAESVGPLLPEDVGAELTVRLLPVRRVEGLVTTAGVPVSGARVRFLWDEPEDPKVPWFSLRPSPRPRDVTTQEDGTFSIELKRSGVYRVEGWEDTVGRGVRGPLSIPDEGVVGLKIELTEAPAAILGRVLLPEGHDPDEVWLSVSTVPGHTRLFRDGSYRLSPVPAGPCLVIVRAGHPRTGTRPGERFEVKRGPTDPPPWLRSVESLALDLLPGEERVLDIDLAHAAPCRVVGVLDLGGQRVEDPLMAWLMRQGRSEPVSRTTVSPGGSFELSALEPGRYNLQVRGFLQGAVILQLVDQVDLVEGATAWRFAPGWGALRVLSSNPAGWPTSLNHYGVRWDRGDGLSALFWGGVLDDRASAHTWAAIPAGRVELVTGWYAGASVGTVVVPEGGTAEFRLP